MDQIKRKNLLIELESDDSFEDFDKIEPKSVRNSQRTT